VYRKNGGKKECRKREALKSGRRLRAMTGEDNTGPHGKTERF
jgi:hypothetical protein